VNTVCTGMYSDSVDVQNPALKSLVAPKVAKITLKLLWLRLIFYCFIPEFVKSWSVLRT